MSLTLRHYNLTIFQHVSYINKYFELISI